MFPLATLNSVLTRGDVEVAKEKISCYTNKYFCILSIIGGLQLSELDF